MKIDRKPMHSKPMGLGSISPMVPFSGSLGGKNGVFILQTLAPIPGEAFGIVVFNLETFNATYYAEREWKQTYVGNFKAYPNATLVLEP